MTGLSFLPFKESSVPNSLFSRFFVRLKPLLWPLVILLSALVIFVVLKQTKPQAPAAQVEEKIWPVAVQTLKSEALSPSQTLFGRVESDRMVSVAAPVAGEVATRHVLAGDTFEQGERLLAMSMADLEVPLTRAEAELADVEAQLASQRLTQKANEQKLVREQKILALKRSELARNQNLLKRDMVSESAVDQAKEALARQEFSVVTAQLAVEEYEARMARLQAQKKRAEANVREARLHWERGQIDAPFDGRVASADVSPGDRVNVGETLMRFYDLDSLVLRAKLPRDQLSQLYAAQRSGQSLVASYEQSGQSVTLPLLRLDGEGTASGVDGFFALPEALLSLRPGDLLSVTLHLPKREGVFAVPYSALYGTDRVYVTEGERLAMRSVTLLGQTVRSGQTLALIAGDLAEGDRVVTTHLPNAVGGLKISVKEAAQPADGGVEGASEKAADAGSDL
ncbi:MAG: HlyD family efflux transporter periplasmic adaptor subunit [Hydrogenovibrio sp.]|uniref:efflux RND transporter periplasmic adaptor subunit n=1 Tax=Hydrogenovibrio sp. TaxID=2065821 RepID=UPI0028709902|nr:HlyD family efflux transporter periplasmic adaptor subunit [Hydrogenovibrio sp.]MDR9498413.1 HlyD family efflux transporter periplasmic adaptor subunit [Hydrogenovibrio sp.]